MFGACSKDNAVVEETPDTKDTVYYIKHFVENLFAPIDDKNPTATPTVFFSTSVNGQNVNNYGAGKQPFESVIAIPEASAFKTAKDLVGTDDAGAFGVGIGFL